MNLFYESQKYRKSRTRLTFNRLLAENLPLAAPFRGARETQLENLKARLLSEALRGTEDQELYAPLRRAANEAAALAWTTWYPLLLFPALFEEKAQFAAEQAERQASIKRRSRSSPCQRTQALR